MDTRPPVHLSDAVRALYPFSSRWTDINGLEYHYIDEGAGEPVIMLHGNPTWSFYYRGLIRGLSGRYRTIAPDHIGCGLSEKPGADAYDYRLESRVKDLEAFLGFLDLKEKITLVVHDWGGMIGMAYAVNHPEKIGRIVILNTAAFPQPADKPIPFRLQLIRNIHPFAAPAVLGLNLFARAAIHMAVVKKLSRPVRQGLLAPYNSWHNRRATLRFVQDIPLVPNDPGYDLVKDTGDCLNRLLSIPMLILWGERDFVFDLDYLTQWQKRFPSASVHRFQNAGHYILEDAPQKCLDLIAQFIEQHPLNREV